MSFLAASLHLQFNNGFNSAAPCIFFFFCSSPLSPRTDGEEWQDTDKSSASLIRVPRFLITVEADAKCVSDSSNASEAALWSKDLFKDGDQDSVWVTLDTAYLKVSLY